ncbi:MAG: hypothetical protein KJ556_20260 [Gammaproteobacteria bacterium]|nr:hypothetical protein [Gammaproteobacteria bacterium]
MAGLTFTTPSVPFSFKKFNGGLNTTSGPLGLEDNESSDLQNIDFDKFGSFGKRNGYTALNTSAIEASQRINGLYWFMTPTLRKPVCACNTKIYRMDSLDGTWDDITGAVTVTAGHRFDYETFITTCLMTNDYDPPIIWSGAGNCSAMTVPTGLTRAKFVKKFQNYCLLANVVVSGVDMPTRFYFSTIKTIDTWDAADFYEVGKDDGEEITGFKVLGDRLIVYKTNSIYAVYFNNDADIPFIIQKTSSHVGCIAPYSIQEVDNGHVFLSYDGIYYFDGNNSHKISNRISETVLGYAKASYVNAVSMYQKNTNRYWLAFATSSDNDRVITWDTYNNAFSLYVGMAPSAMAIFLNNGVEERPYFGDYSGFVYRADVSGTASDYPLNVKTAINAYFWTNWKDYQDLCDQKGIAHIYIYHKKETATLAFAHAYDFNTTDQYSTTFSTTNSDDVSSIITRRDLTGRGKVARFKFANATADETFRIDGIGTTAHLETHK